MEKLRVALNGTVVGTLEKHVGGAMSFVYQEEWLAQAGSRAISLSLPLQPEPFRGDVVYNFFDNLLPDSELIRSRIQARFRTVTKQPFDLLSSIGGDCVGAIQLYPEHAEVAPVKQVNAVPISDEEIEQLLQGYREAPLGMGPNSDDFRISLAGAQEKTALLWFNNQWCRPEGSTPTSHIIKLPIGHIAHNNLDLSESCENEWLCLRMAEQFGLPVAQTQLAHFGEQKVLIVERFDRRWARDNSWLIRLPQEDFCQALSVPPALKYEADGGPDIAAAMELLLGSQQPLLDRDTFFKSQIVFWMLAAIDGHAKNFSLFLQPETTYRMTPLYDVLSGYPFMHARGIAPQKAKMAMAAIGKGRHYRWSQILPRHFISTARAVGYSEEKARQMMAELKAQTEQAIANVEAMLPEDFPRFVSEAIFAGVRRQAARLPG